MPSHRVLPLSGRRQTSKAPTHPDSGRAHTEEGARKVNRRRFTLRDFLAGLNEILKVGEFSRGDDFRD